MRVADDAVHADAEGLRLTVKPSADGKGLYLLGYRDPPDGAVQLLNIYFTREQWAGLGRSAPKEEI